LAGKVTAGLAESNGSLPLGGWLKIKSSAGLLPVQSPVLALVPTLGNEYEKTLPFLKNTIGCETVSCSRMMNQTTILLTAVKEMVANLFL